MKPKAKQKKPTPQTAPATATKKKASGKKLPAIYWLMGIIAITVIVFWPGIKGQLTTWDDDVYISSNKVLKADHLTWKSVNKVVAGNWSPLLVAQLWAEYHLFETNKDDPPPGPNDNAHSLSPNSEAVYDGTGYHAVSLLMHLLNGIFLFLFFRQLSKSMFQPQYGEAIALLATTIFYIHPMHVESVSWASETKDVGYAMWYHAALWIFCVYIEKRQVGYLVLTGFLFLVSALYKGQAVTLPAALALVAIVKTQSTPGVIQFDWEKAIPGWLKGMKIQEWVFFVLAGCLSLAVGKMAFAAQAEMNFLDNPEITRITLFDRVIAIFFGMGNYIVKSVVPYGFSLFHPYPARVAGAFGWDVYAIALAPFVVLFLLVYLRRNLAVTFAILFFFVHILPVSQLFAVGTSNYWERYSYISYDGFCLLAASLAVYFYHKQKYATVGIVAGYLIFFGYTSHERTKVWHDNKTLYTDGLIANPNNALINGCLGTAYFHEGNIPEAKKYLDRCLGITKSLPIMLVTRAHIYVGEVRPDMSIETRITLLDSAIDDCKTAISYKNDSSNAYGGLGICYSMKGDMTGQKNMFDSARVYLLDALDTHGADSADICLNIGHTFNNAGNPEAALPWYSRAIKADPKLWPPYIYRGLILYAKGKPFWPAAMEDFKVAEIHDLKPANRELATTYIRMISAGVQ